jgi:hypothetical protein
METISFDRAFNRWLVLNIVDVATGAKRVINMPQVNGNWSAIDWTANGIYLTLISGEGPGDLGLWGLNPDSGTVRKLEGTQY